MTPLSTENIEALSIEEIRQVLHELRVHQIELEVQNVQLRTTQEELEVIRAHYFDLYDIAPVGYCTLSEKGLILEANLTTVNLLGVPKSSLVRQPFTRFILNEDQSLYYLHSKQFLETGKLHACELRMVKKDGTAFWVRLEMSAARNADGAPVSRLVISDITERKQAEMEKNLESQNRQLKKAESLGRMAGAIAHHFNNQLYVVIGNLELVMNDLPLGSDERERLIDAMKASHRAADVSRLMLTYLGQTPGKLELQDLSETCHKGLLMLQTFIPKNVLMAPVISFPGPTVRANMSQMHQIFTNLVTNAWESISNKKGTITLSVNTVASADIRLSHVFPINWRPKETLYACLEVADTGSGITNEEIEKVFDPFFTTKFVGRGLGLAVALGVVSAHGGGITVESEIGRGSIFRVFLPVCAEAVSVSLEVEKTAQIIESGSVLVIEDDPDVRHMAKAMLSRIGFTVLEATDGVEAMEIFSQHQDNIRCVLSDLTMPRMDGWETLAALRKLSPDIPVILSSGYDEAQVMANEHPDRPNAFLGKPYQLRELRETITRVLSAPVQV
jgi:PAS domain S-box-containing protein